MSVYPREMISIIVPVRNEGEGLGKILQKLKRYASEIIVIDGHSVDRTRQICEEEKVKFILDHGLGRGDGVRIGLSKAKGQIIVMVDGDGSHDLQDIPKMVQTLSKREADFVIGSRRLGGSFDLDMSIAGVIRSSGADLLTAIVNARFQTNLSDILYSFRAIRKDAVSRIKLHANDFSIDQEMVVACLKKGLHVVQIPSREHKRGWGESKLRTSAGIKLLFDLLQSLL